MSLDNLQSLLVEQLQDVYYAEKQLVKALPKMAKAASSKDLKDAFSEHGTQTEEHVARLEQVFEALGVAARAKKCPAIEGLIDEAGEMMEQDGSPAVKDAGLIASAQRVEHYEMAAYGNLRVFAEALGHQEVVALLDTTLADEYAADELLSEISADTVLPAALEAEDFESDEDQADADRGAGKSAKATGTRRPR